MEDKFCDLRFVLKSCPFVLWIFFEYFYMLKYN